MMMDFNASWGRDNHITAMSLARLYKHIFECRDRDAYINAEMEYLRSQQFVISYHFTGEKAYAFTIKRVPLDRVEHDGV